MRSESLSEKDEVISNQGEKIQVGETLTVFGKANHSKRDEIQLSNNQQSPNGKKPLDILNVQSSENRDEEISSTEKPVKRISREKSRRMRKHVYDESTPSPSTSDDHGDKEEEIVNNDVNEKKTIAQPELKEMSSIPSTPSTTSTTSTTALPVTAASTGLNNSSNSSSHGSNPTTLGGSSRALSSPSFTSASSTATIPITPSASASASASASTTTTTSASASATTSATAATTSATTSATASTASTASTVLYASQRGVNHHPTSSTINPATTTAKPMMMTSNSRLGNSRIYHRDDNFELFTPDGLADVMSPNLSFNSQWRDDGW